jgi:hypothetical protein
MAAAGKAEAISKCLPVSQQPGVDHLPLSLAALRNEAA